ncbi:sortase [Candidatus Beckwithbacteria bacterium]|nr:sortase [Candidatus Beckwithbacteria bacterium]
MQYCYYKAHLKTESRFQKKQKELLQKFLRVIPNALIIVGATAVMTVFYPMISYQLNASRWNNKKIVAPLTKNELAIDKNLAYQNQNKAEATDPVMAYQQENAPQIVDFDYTKASNWFSNPEKENKTEKKELVSTYTLSIPKLDIENMKVLINGENLDESLIQYAGTALPGEYGNPVIFGHSVLPVFYNPKNYMSVFSKIPTLKEGDEIFVSFDGIEYKYEVESYHEVEPDEIEVLEQRYDRKTLTLITCVPPGTYLRRGVVLAKLVQD